MVPIRSSLPIPLRVLSPLSVSVSCSCAAVIAVPTVTSPSAGGVGAASVARPPLTANVPLPGRIVTVPFAGGAVASALTTPRARDGLFAHIKRGGHRQHPPPGAVFAQNKIRADTGMRPGEGGDRAGRSVPVAAMDAKTTRHLRRQPLGPGHGSGRGALQTQTDVIGQPPDRFGGVRAGRQHHNPVRQFCPHGPGNQICDALVGGWWVKPCRARRVRFEVGPLSGGQRSGAALGRKAERRLFLRLVQPEMQRPALARDPISRHRCTGVAQPGCFRPAPHDKPH